MLANVIGDVMRWLTTTPAWVQIPLAVGAGAVVLFLFKRMTGKKKKKK